MKIIKDPQAVLDYFWDWSEWLKPNELIEEYEIIPPSTITVESHTQLEGIVRTWLSGGTINQNAPVVCRISTNQNRIDERTIELIIRDR